MEQAQVVAKIITDLTCWKCGEESLKATAAPEVKRGSQNTLLIATDIKHSICGKCGTYSVNPAQALQNKILGRKIRKERILESNRSSK